MRSTDFQELIAQKGRQLYRDMPWRDNTEPYYVLVSELMLQQTQVERVVPKFKAFIEIFPTVESLAQASLGDVLRLWSGLGYNRRAKYLHQAAQMIVNEYCGKFPAETSLLQRLPGVGKNTAGAILAYAFNQPALFVETNVRAVYFYHFFKDSDRVDDKQIMALLERTIDRESPRHFYWALMDYGSYLKKQGVANIKISHHYRPQSLLEGSVRQVRGQIIRLLSRADASEGEIRAQLPQDERAATALTGLQRDGLITRSNDLWHLTK